uniref:uncharacterized protein LOC122601308 n=1 Tax=Erigeron canadensis TaxID=72917 RepID=UPI001CB9B3BE|nr:uncharacterized protein LOC122601308 [Erigeron canadensis]
MDEVKAAYLNAECSAILQNQPIPPNLEDPGSASINLMPYSVWSKLASGILRPTRMSIRLADHSFQYPIGIAENMTVQVGHIVFLVDFVSSKWRKILRIYVIDDVLDQEFEEYMETEVDEELTHFRAGDIDDD